jgi:hypothetical protein
VKKERKLDFTQALNLRGCYLDSDSNWTGNSSSLRQKIWSLVFGAVPVTLALRDKDCRIFGNKEG